MEIIKNFGLNPVLLGAQVLNFLIVLFILKKVLYKPILDVLKKRQTTIREGLEHAENARIKLEKVLIEEKNILRNAQLQSKKIIEDAKQELTVVTRQANEEAKNHTEKLLIDAKEQIAKESAATEKRLAMNTSKLAVTFLEKTLREFFSSKEQKEVISQALKKMKKID
ncbi:MAG: ATP synthase subunit b [Candidatus Levybacteria bacterium GW2011_GWA2_37_36]|nr:MAG: ATP synthase subunit b [Candidatus Levybacteria bacterium GW2011_GWA1_37_16]KKQ33683.1 MAG: ATP synthase subunit b [Candidatus Levybacteria bacterium GW2011_GWA2_37_36]KKQ37586.1 MAG: ATP synthase subunit b [Candidatus Levybacteria bacterium GW2011_GWC2_37_7]KKQ41509.1 MAG: ATP synthase subunit b [Candidatus Levybacteria bacterium GW2011_GWB1_37_8]OGH51026.1 MAG: ATP synthase F0 subunit B [Candidatus Levybacteria bacterium RIFCSPLOWO2_12_FULL_37_14]